MSFFLVDERLEEKEKEKERERERERGEKKRLLAGRGEGWLEVTAEKHLVGDAFNVRQRAVVVVIGGLLVLRRYLTVVPAAEDALDEITDEKRRP